MISQHRGDLPASSRQKKTSRLTGIVNCSRCQTSFDSFVQEEYNNHGAKVNMGISQKNTKTGKKIFFAIQKISIFAASNSC
jgi:hypothetical protein